MLAVGRPPHQCSRAKRGDACFTHRIFATTPALSRFHSANARRSYRARPPAVLRSDRGSAAILAGMCPRPECCHLSRRELAPRFPRFRLWPQLLVRSHAGSRCSAAYGTEDWPCCRTWRAQMNTAAEHGCPCHLRTKNPRSWVRIIATRRPNETNCSQRQHFHALLPCWRPNIRLQEIQCSYPPTPSCRKG